MINSDGERQAPLNIETAEASHLARYKFALEFINTNDVILDAPCGSGYGCALMVSKAKNVFGIDINGGAIDHAKELFSVKGTNYIVGDIQNMFVNKNSFFDKIISFEGIEHLDFPEKFLSEVKRLLKKDGVFLVSTPRKPHGSPYHKIEYSFKEFEELLSKYFTIDKIFGQIFTDIFELSKRKVNPMDYQRFNFIAVCSKK